MQKSCVGATKSFILDANDIIPTLSCAAIALYASAMPALLQSSIFFPFMLAEESIAYSIAAWPLDILVAVFRSVFKSFACPLFVASLIDSRSAIDL